jgi:tetratricopeptide (TPR) repeat protein
MCTPAHAIIATLMTFFRLTWMLLVVFGLNGLPQSPSAGQARSPEEFDGYLLVLSKSVPKEVIPAAENFERQWPNSELLAHVLELKLEAYRSLGDSSNAILAGERALKAAPDNLLVLTNIAYIIASTSNNRQQLARAEHYARRELELSTSIRIPKRISVTDWDEISGQQNSTVHAALGLVDYKRGDIAGAIKEFETAVKLAPVPDPTQYYRLGKLYRASGKETQAIEMLQRAVASNDAIIRPLAESELQSLGRKQRSN